MKFASKITAIKGARLSPIIDQAQEWQTLQEKIGRSVALARFFVSESHLLMFFWGQFESAFCIEAVLVASNSYCCW